MKSLFTEFATSSPAEISALGVRTVLPFGSPPPKPVSLTDPAVSRGLCPASRWRDWRLLVVCWQRVAERCFIRAFRQHVRDLLLQNLSRRTA